MRAGRYRAGRRGVTCGLVIAAVLTHAGCASSARDANPRDAVSNVVIRLVAFKPDRLEVGLGRAVRWSQRDAGPHTVTSGRVGVDAAGIAATSPDGTFASGDLAQGRSFRVTFEQRGVFPYFCQLHPATMRGEIVVE